MSASRKWYVYALCEPKTGRVRYIGKSVNPAQRLASHKSSNGCSKKIREWLLSIGEQPVLEILGERDTETEALLLEQSLIKSHGRRNLLNASDGGESPKPHRKAKFVGIGQRVRGLREARGMGVRDLARECGIGCGTLSRLENGLREHASAEVAVIIARSLQTTVEYLVTGVAA